MSIVGVIIAIRCIHLILHYVRRSLPSAGYEDEDEHGIDGGYNCHYDFPLMLLLNINDIIFWKLN